MARQQFDVAVSSRHKPHNQARRDIHDATAILYERQQPLRQEKGTLQMNVH